MTGIAGTASACMHGGGSSRPSLSKPPENAAAQSRAGKQEPASLAALAERHRDRVLDLAARGHLPNAIRAITRLEYRVVAAILAMRPTRKEMRP